MSTVVLDGGPIWLFLLARLVELGVVILLTVVWCNSMERALRACDYSSRKMQLGQSWLIFVPLFGFIWQFIAVNRVSDSLATEYHLRGWKSDEGRPGIETGLIACVLVVVVFLVRTFVVLHPALELVMSMAICICMYMHRERLNAFTERLETENKKTAQTFSFDAGPNPFSQQFSQQPISQQSFGQQTYSQQPFGRQMYNQQPNYNQQNQQTGFPAFAPPVHNPYQPPQNIPPVQQYTHEQFVQQSAQQYNHQQQQQKRQQEEQRPGWDGVTTWEAPAEWKHPDLTDPRAYFS